MVRCRAYLLCDVAYSSRSATSVYKDCQQIILNMSICKFWVSNDHHRQWTYFMRSVLAIMYMRYNSHVPPRLVNKANRQLKTSWRFACVSTRMRDKSNFICWTQRHMNSDAVCRSLRLGDEALCVEHRIASEIDYSLLFSFCQQPPKKKFLIFHNVK